MSKRKAWFRRAHYDENVLVDRYFRKGGVALRIPISGAGRFKGDVLGFRKHNIDLIAHRRDDAGKGHVVFKESEINDLMLQSRTIAYLLSSPICVNVLLVAHFPKKRKWVVIHLLHFEGGDVKINDKGEISLNGEYMNVFWLEA